MGERQGTTISYMVMKLCYQINKFSSDVLLQKKNKMNKIQDMTDVAQLFQEVIQQI